MYRYLEDDDVIQEGDEWITNYRNRWILVSSSIGYTLKDYIRSGDLDLGFKIRRKVNITKLGNKFT